MTSLIPSYPLFSFDHDFSEGRNPKKGDSKKTKEQESLDQEDRHENKSSDNPSATIKEGGIEESFSLLLQKKAYEDGYAQGKLEGREEERGAHAQVMEDFLTRLEGLRKDQESKAEAMHQQALTLAYTLAVRLSLNTLKAHAGERIQEIVSEALQNQLTPTPLTVWMHPNVRERHPESFALLEGRVTFQWDSQLAPYECRVEGEGGGVEGRITPWLANVDSAFQSFLCSCHDLEGSASILNASQQSIHPSERDVS